MQVADEHERGSELRSSPTPQLSRKLDFTQRIEKKLASYNASESTINEITCWVVSAASLGAIIGIYAHVSNTRLADQSNLLTLANILGKISSAALIVPTTEALGQFKCN
jgi:hypothetical protein